MGGVAGMSDDIRKVPFSASFWPGLSGDLSSDIWIVGYYYDYTTGAYLKLATGAASPVVIFGGTLPQPYSAQSVSGSGTLSGVLTSNLFAIEDNAAFTDEEIHGNVLTMLLAGEDTTANTLAWMLPSWWSSRRCRT